MFDPWREILLLVGGDKSGNWNRWYREAIKQAEDFYADYLETRNKENRQRARTLDTANTHSEHRDAAAMELYDWNEIRKEYVDDVGGEEEARRRRDDVLATAHGYRLAELRKRAGLTQAQLAESMGVTKQRVSQIEHGRADSLGLDVLMRYATALGGRLRVVIDYGDEISTVA